jgi:sugar lactone lactonase YvrE
MADTGAWFDLALYEELAALPDSPGLEAVQERLEEIHRPQGTAEAAFRVPDPFLIPEGIAFDPRTGTFFLSSLRGGSIVATVGDGTAREFAGDEAGLYGGLGLEVDEGRGCLWAVSAAFEGVEGYTEEMKGFSTLSCFDLESGERLLHLDLTDPESPHTFADLVVDSAGGVFVTDALDGGVYRLAPGTEELEAFVPPGTVFGPNGITLDEKRGLLYVAQYNLDVVAVDLADGSVHPLGRPDDVVLYGVDGLYVHGDALLAIQNHPSLDRVVRLPLSGDGRSVTGAEILVARHPLFEEPTTGIPVGDRFYFIANSQIEKMARAEDPHPDDFEETVILEVDLGR